MPALSTALAELTLLYLFRHQLGLINLSSVLCLPCNEKTVRGITDVKLLVVDEAAQVPDSFYNSVLGMLAPDGRVVCLSTPYGRRGFFWRLWASGDPSWRRIEIPASQVPRLTPAFLDQQRRDMGESWFQQEYGCAFGAMEGLIYPDFAQQAIRGREPEWRQVCARGTRVGGLDFGDNFAAVWGVLDHEGVLWLTDEHYHAGLTLAQHARYLPREVMWYSDPSGKVWIGTEVGPLQDPQGAGRGRRRHQRGADAAGDRQATDQAGHLPAPAGRGGSLSLGPGQAGPSPEGERPCPGRATLPGGPDGPGENGQVAALVHARRPPAPRPAPAAPRAAEVQVAIALQRGAMDADLHDLQERWVKNESVE
jgi:hypothetical protein